MYTVLFSNICEPKRNYGSYVQQLLFAAQLDLWKQRQSKKKKKEKKTTKNFIHTEHKNPGHSHILLSLRVKHALKLWIKFDPQVN